MLSALGKAAAKLREKLGESLASVAKYNVLNNAEQIGWLAFDPNSGQLRLLRYFNTPVGVSPNTVALSPSGKFLYVTDGASDNKIYGYSVNPIDGSLTPVINSPFTAAVTQLTIDPTGSFLYTFGNGLSTTVSGFVIDQVTGELSPVPGSPFAFPAPYAYTLIVEGSGRYLYVLGGDDLVYGYAIASDGSLTALQSPPGSATRSNHMVTTASGSFLYLESMYSGTKTLYGFSVDPNTGALTPVPGSPYNPQDGSGQGDIWMHPSGQFLYAIGYSVPGFSIDQTTGALTALSGMGLDSDISPFIDPSGQYLYIYPSFEEFGIVPLVISSNGQVTPTSVPPLSILGAGALETGPTFTTGSSAVMFTPKFLYTANSGSNNVSAYAIDSSTGQLSSISGSPFGVGITPGAVVAEPLGRFVYVVNQGDNTVSAFSINSTSGVLSPVPGQPFAVGTQPVSATTDLDGQFLYVANQGSDNISAFLINPASGSLTPISGSPIATGRQPSSISVDPLGAYLAVTNSGDNTVSTFQITPGSGVLSFSQTLSTGTDPVNVSFTLTFGEWYYVANQGSNDISIYSLGAGLTFPAGMSNPRACTVDATGQYLYVVGGPSGSEGSINAFAIGFDSLTQLPGFPISVGKTPTAINVDGSGKFLYVTNSGDNNISAFQINTTTGALTPIGTVPTGTGPSSVSSTFSVQ